MIVIDASAMIELLLGHSLGEEVDALLGSGQRFAAPHLLPIEVLNALRKGLLSKRMTGSVADRAVQDYARLDIAYYDAAPFVQDIWKLRDNFTAYDATYLALAMKLSSPLLTRDQRLASRAKDLVSVL